MESKQFIKAAKIAIQEGDVGALLAALNDDLSGQIAGLVTTGIYTPAWSFSGGGSVTPAGPGGGYIRIGALCIVSLYAATSALSGPSGDVRISLPVAATLQNAPNYDGAAAVISDGWGSNAPVLAKAKGGQSYAELFYPGSAGAGKVQASQMVSGSYKNVIQATIMYFTADPDSE